MEISPVDERTIRLAGESSFDIREFGMQPPKVLMLKVEPEVDVRVEIFAVRGRVGDATPCAWESPASCGRSPK